MQNPLDAWRERRKRSWCKAQRRIELKDGYEVFPEVFWEEELARRRLSNLACSVLLNIVLVGIVVIETLWIANDCG